MSRYQHAIVVGDFNVDLLQPSDRVCGDLLGVASSFGLTQVVRVVLSLLQL